MPSLLMPFTCCETALHVSRFSTEMLDKVADLIFRREAGLIPPSTMCKRGFDCRDEITDECLRRSYLHQSGIY